MNLHKQYSGESGLGGLLELVVVHKVDGRMVDLAMHTLAAHMLGEGDMADCLLLAVHFEFRKIYSADVGHLAEKC
jgi:hypothetical protein